MTGRPDFIAGNTRLRARLGGLLGPRDYDRLAGLSYEAVVESLSATAYRPYLGRRREVDGQVVDAVTQRLRDLLRGVRELYGGTAREVVGVLLARHDLHDVLALLRGARTGQPGSDRLAAVMAVGALDQQGAADVGSAADGATAVTRLAARRLPDRATAQALQVAWERFELNADPDELENAVASSAIDGWTTLLARAGKAARPALELVLAECDRANLLAVLRDPAGEPPRLLHTGMLDSRTLSAAPRNMAPVLAVRPAWREAIDRYTDDGDLTALEWNLDVAMSRQAVRGLRRGDPLGADVSVGYVLAAECEARNVRLVLLAARRGRGTDVRASLVA